MDNNIKINFKELEAKTETLNNSFIKILELVNKQDKMLASLVDESIWKGPSRNAVLDKKNEIRNQTKNLKDTLNSYTSYLRIVISQYNTLDNNLSNEQEKRLNS